MIDRFSNVYDDKARADAYAKLEFPGTYYLAYRDLPAIISEHVKGAAALDFGCGTGRSTRGGRIVSLVWSPDIYINEWSSFSTKDFPENRTTSCGDKVRIVMVDVPDQRPVEDILWTDEGYREVHERAGLTPVKTYRPLANKAAPHERVSETAIAPWVIYVLGHGK